MNKTLFLDRDGTLIFEPPVTKQVNSLNELSFIPAVISSLKKLSDAGYTLVVVTNQDGLGTAANPRDMYDLINAKMMETFNNEGVFFADYFECPHFEKDNCNCRKPLTGMLDKYLQNNDICLQQSYVIGDRHSDLQLAENISIKGFMLSPETTWPTITEAILNADKLGSDHALTRTAVIERKTQETRISIRLDLDGSGKYTVNTGLKFFDHMLEQLVKHSSFDMDISCQGDLQIDEHHTIEDTAIAIGQAIKNALGDKRGIERYAWERILIMDEAKTEVSIDISGRPFVEFEADFKREYVGDFPTEMVAHFFHSLCLNAGINAHFTLHGSNDHHIIECCFKAFARCLKDAVQITSTNISSTKGIL